MTDLETKQNLTADIVKYRKTYYENNKDYYHQLYNNNKEELKKKETCKLCGGSYQLWNKGHHANSKRHLQTISKLSSQREEFEKLFEEYKDKIKSLI